MAEKTDISWTDATINFWWGCAKYSPGCLHCYADQTNDRHQRAEWGVGTIRTWIDGCEELAGKLNRKARRTGEVIKAFSNSMSDFFEVHDTLDGYRERAWDIIRKNRHLKWLLLTKRSNNIIRNLPEDFFDGGFSHVHLGASVESETYVNRLDDLRSIRDWGGVRWISYEPALSPIDHVVNLDKISWVIYGGESSMSLKGFRKDNDEWARRIRDKCERENVAFFYKQNSGLKKNLIETLDGVEYKKYPLL